jgi:hypothetical protein
MPVGFKIGRMVISQHVLFIILAARLHIDLFGGFKARVSVTVCYEAWCALH